MFGIGMNEFLLLVLLALVVIGPKRLPEVARGIGKLMVQFKRATRDLREAVSDEVNAHPELKELQEIRSELNADLGAMQQRARNYVDEEFKKEQEIAGAVERDVQGVADRVQKDIRDTGEEDIGGAPPEEEAAPSAQDQARSYIDEEFHGESASSGDGETAPPGDNPAESKAAPTPSVPAVSKMKRPYFGDAVPDSFKPQAANAAADSPEDDYVAEREAAQAAEAQPAEGDPGDGESADSSEAPVEADGDSGDAPGPSPATPTGRDNA